MKITEMFWKNENIDFSNKEVINALNDVKEFLEKTVLKPKDNNLLWVKSFGVALFYHFCKKYSDEYSLGKLAGYFDIGKSNILHRLIRIKKKYPNL